MKKIFILIAVICTVLQAEAQDNRTSIARVISPSPTASSIAKFGEIPVSHYTGVSNIGIPLYEIKANEISVPINLSYHCAGIRVQEEASWVGLGWALFTGGVISRVVNGSDDLKGLGYPNSYLPTSYNPSTGLYEASSQQTLNRDLMFLKDVVDGVEDTEPDIFQYNINGHSGKFVLNRKTPTAPFGVTILSQEEVKIEVIYNQAAFAYQWIITDEKGIKYHFSTGEVAISRTGVSAEEAYSDLISKDAMPSETVTTWYLDKIVSPKGDSVNFTYSRSYPGTRKVFSRSQTKRHVVIPSFASAVGAVCIIPSNEYTYYTSYSEVQDVYLRQITFPGGKIEFNLSNRTDIEPVPNTTALTYAQKLDSINIYAKNGSSYSLLRKFNFNYAYFENGRDAYLHRRLKLLSVNESDGVNNRPPYAFSYNTLGLPAKDDKGIDHWGFYNGARNNDIKEINVGDRMARGTLIPPITLLNYQTQQMVDFVGADREPNPQFSQASTLQQITYPTGGTSTFEYEQNDYYGPRKIFKKRPITEYLQKKGPTSTVVETSPNEIVVTFDTPMEVIVRSHWACIDKSCISIDADNIEFDAVDIYKKNGNSDLFWMSLGINLNYYNQESGDAENYFDLPAGTYKFKALSDGSFFNWADLSYAIVDTIITKVNFGPGLRIKKIMSYDGISHSNDSRIEYDYKMKIVGEDSLYSSGILMTEPIYTYDENIEYKCPYNESGNDYMLSTAIAKFRVSSTVMPISGAAQGGPLGYTQVTEYRSGAGKTIYEYYNIPDVIPYPIFPNVPTIPNSKNGLLAEQRTFTSLPDGKYKLAKKVYKTYAIDHFRDKKLTAMKVPEAKFVTYDQNMGIQYTFKSVKFYDIFSEFVHPETEIVTDYSTSNTTDSLIQTINYEYAHPTYLQLTKMQTLNSKQQILTSNYKYPFDFPTDPTYVAMVNSHQVARQIEEIRTTNGVHTQSIRQNYAIWPTNLILPFNVQVKNGSEAYDTRVLNTAYDDVGNLLTQAKNNDLLLSYKWGYSSQYPVVEISNANANQFYYESFEYGTNAGIAQVFAKTGMFVKPSGFTVNFTVPDQKQYVLTYWYRNGTTGTWNMKSVNYSGPSYIISDGTYIDEVRICPVDALMKTYTYDPLVGVSSESDPSGKTIYYTYDTFGQLKFIRDQDGKILKRYDYQYQRPVGE